MAQSIDSLSQISTLDTGYLLIASDPSVASYNMNFANFRRNLNEIRSTGVDMTLGADTDTQSIVISSSTKKVGVGSMYTGAAVLYDFEVGGTSGIDTYLGLRGTGVDQNLIFDDDIKSWQFTKDTINDFYLSGLSSNYINLLFPSGGGAFISDGAGNAGTGLDFGVDVQLYAENKIRFSVDDSTNSLDLDFTSSGLQCNSDLYVDYYSGANATSGSFFGLSGAVFVSNVNQNTRIGNIDTFPDARLLVSTQDTDGVTYKTALLESDNKPNLYFRETDSNSTVSITYDGVNSLNFGKNRPASTTSLTDPLIIDLGNRKMGFGGLVPSYVIDATGTAASMTRVSSSNPTIIHKIKSDYPSSSGPVESIFTTYSSGVDNKFLHGFDFQNEYYFFQTGDTTDQYNIGVNTHEFNTSGDINISRYYTTNDKFSQGKFLQTHYASCTGGSPTYVNLNNANYSFNPVGNIGYHNLAPLSGRVIGVDLVCDSAGSLANKTGYLVFNKFLNVTTTDVGGTDYITGTNYFQIYDAAGADYFNSVTLSSNAYVSGLIGSDNIFRLAAKYGGTVGGAFRNPSNLQFDKFNYIGWVFYYRDSNGISILDKPFTLSTTVEYFVESDTETENGSYIGS